MLKQLTIKNLALLEDDGLDLTPGLTVLTGETGAGKSIVLDALGLVLGRRADGALVREGAGRLTVTAAFESLPRSTAALLRELDLVNESSPDELLIRREVEPAGKSKAFVNDRPVGVPTLARLGDTLVDIHSQHENLSILKPAEQRNLLDAHGNLSALRDRVSALYDAWEALLKEKAAAALSDQERAQRLDVYRHQAQELNAVDPRPEEEETLEAALPGLRNAEKWRSLTDRAERALSGDDDAATVLAQRARESLNALVSLGAPLNDALGCLDDALLQLQDVSDRLARFAAGVPTDPARLEETLSRLDVLARLKKKYGPTLADVVAYRERVTRELERLENADLFNRDLEKNLVRAERDLKTASDALSAARAAAGKKLAAAVNKEFRDVGLPQATFDIRLEAEAAGFTRAGTDRVVFIFAPNPGEGDRPLADVASGGELSRVLLAIKSVLAKTHAVPLLVFDEIDAGVGGALGAALGKKLSALAVNHQVVCVTHLATIAAFADQHIVVEKTVQNDRTRTGLRSVTADDRVAEIARMFGGTGRKDEDAAGWRHARELLVSSRGKNEI